MLGQYTSPLYTNQPQRAPYQWPSVNMKSNKLLDFSNTGYQQNSSHRSSSQSAGGSKMNTAYNTINYQRSDQQHHMLSVRKLEPDSNTLPSPNHKESRDLYYNSIQAINKHRLVQSVADGRQDSSSPRREGRTTESLNRVRNEHTSPLRSSSNGNERLKLRNQGNYDYDLQESSHQYNQFKQTKEGHRASHTIGALQPNRQNFATIGPVSPYQNYEVVDVDQNESSRQEDMESVILKMHNKMKNLESRYLDLANFYKRELLTNGSNNSRQNNFMRQSVVSDTFLQPPQIINNSADVNRMNRSPIRDQPPFFDQTLERVLIGDLLREKSELERQLQDLMQPKNDAPLANQREKTVQDKRMTQILDNFQETFLEFINQNYQSFTESDVLDHFATLRLQIANLISGEQHNDIGTYQGDIQEALKQAISEYELNSGYTTQSIKKTAFELQSKHGTAQLDSKKAQIALQAIQRKCYQLQETISPNMGSYTSSIERSPQHHSSGRSNSNARISSAQPTSPTTKQNPSRFIAEIQGQVQILSQSLFSIVDKLGSCDEDLRYLMNEVEDEQLSHLEQFKSGLDQLLIEVSTNYRAPHLQSPSPIANEESFSNLGQLQADLDMARSELEQLREQNYLLQQEGQQLNSKGSFGISQPANDIGKLQKLEQDNQHLAQQLRQLTRKLNVNQAERLKSDNSSSRERSRERVSLEQIQFYQKKYDDSLISIKELVKLTQRFLSTMKRLQKAVHRKENNVSAEKQEFEESRKDLEVRLREVKREIDSMIYPHDQMQKQDPTLQTIDQHQSNNLSEGAKATAGGINAQVHRYQNKAPHTLTARNSSHSSSQSGVNVKRQNINSSNPYQNSQSKNASNVIYDEEGKQAHSKEKSPAPMNRNAQRELLYHSHEEEEPSLLSTIQKQQSAQKVGASPLIKKPDNSEMKQQLDGLRDDNRRLSEQIREIQTDKTEIEQQCIELQNELANEKHNRQQLERDYNDLAVQKESLIQELERLEQLEGEETKTEELFTRIQALEHIIEEQRSTIAMMEENSQAAKTTFDQLRKRADQKDNELKKLQKSYQDMQAVAQQQKELGGQVKDILLNQISNVAQEMEFKCQEMEMILSAKDQQITKIRRQLERKLKEREDSDAQFVGRSEKQIATLKSNSGLLEAKVQQLQEELRLSQDHTVEIQNAHNDEIKSIKSKSNTQIEELQNQLTVNFETQLEDKINEFNQELQSVKSLHESEKQVMRDQLQQYREKFESIKVHYENTIKTREDSLLQQFSEHEEQLQAMIEESQAQVDLTQKELKESQKQLESKTKEVASLKNQYKGAQVEIEQLQEQSHQYSSSNRQLEAHVNELQNQIASYLGSIEKLNTQSESITKNKESTVKAREQQIAALQLENQRYSVAAEELQTEVRKMKEELAEKELECDQAEEQRENQELELQKIQNQNQELLKNSTQLKQQLDEQSIALQEIQNKCGDLQGQNEDLIINNDSLVQQLQTSKTQVLNAQSQYDQLQERWTTLQKQYEQTLYKSEIMQSEITQLNASIERFKSQAEQLKLESENKLDSKDQDLEQLQTRFDQLLNEREGSLSATQTELLQHQSKLASQKSHFEQTVKEYQTQQEMLESQVHEKEEVSNSLRQEVERLKTSEEKGIKLQQILENRVLELENQERITETEYNNLLELSETLKQENNELIEGIQHLKEDSKSKQEEKLLLKNELEQQRQDLQRAKNDAIQYVNQIQELTSQLSNGQEAHKNLEEQILSSQQAIQEYQQMIKTLKQTAQDSDSQHVETLQQMNSKVTSLQNEVQNSKLEISNLNIALTQKEAKLNEVLGERKQLQEQLRELVDQSTIEKQSLEDVLRKQLTQALEDIQAKEGEVAERDAKIDELMQSLQQSASNVEELVQRVKDTEEAFEQQELELQESENERQKIEQKFAKNLELIQLFKSELEKNIEKEKKLIAHNSQMQDNESTLNRQIVELTDQVQKLKKEYEEKLLAQQPVAAPLAEESSYLHNLEEDMKAKDELIEEANKFIEEFNDEKHEIKAKFKHLMLILDDPNMMPEEESSYKEDDEIDLNECFERFEAEVMKAKKRTDIKISNLEDDNMRVKQDLVQRDDEVRSTLDAMSQVNQEIEELRVKFEQNDIEMRRQLDNASRKLLKYKTKLNEKQAQFEELIKQQVAPQIEEPTKQNDMALENIKLIQRLKKAENELQTYRLAHESHQRVNPDHSAEEQHSLKVDNQRLQQMEEQLVNLRRQLFEAKDVVLDALTEQFGKRFKDLQSAYRNDTVLKVKIQEMTESQRVLALNNSVKAVKEVVFQSGGEKKSFAILQVQEGQHYFVDLSKMSEIALAFVRSYLPSTEDLELDIKQTRELENLEEELKDIRDERQELIQELVLYKNKINASTSQNDVNQYTDLKGVELEEEVTHLTAENLEIRIKIKELSEKNRLLQIRILELAQSHDDSRKVSVLKEENEILKQQLNRHEQASHKRLNDDDGDDEHFEEGLFLQGIQVAENINTSIPNDINNNNLFDQSSGLINVIEDLGESQRASIGQNVIEKLQKENDELKQRLQQSLLQLNNASSSVLTSGEQGILKHIKGTLFQFLKNCPLTDRNNEELLSIVFSMMEFTRDEIHDIQDFRNNKRTNMASQGRANSVSSAGGTDPGDEDVRKKTSKGIFGMFRKQSSKDKERKGPSNNVTGEDQSSSITSPVKSMPPIKRH